MRWVDPGSMWIELVSIRDAFGSIVGPILHCGFGSGCAGADLGWIIWCGGAGGVGGVGGVRAGREGD